MGILENFLIIIAGVIAAFGFGAYSGRQKERNKQIRISKELQDEIDKAANDARSDGAIDRLRERKF